MDGGSDGLPLGDLSIAPDSGHMAHAAGASGDEGALGDDQCARDGGALGIVVAGYGERDMLGISPIAG